MDPRYGQEFRPKRKLNKLAIAIVFLIVILFFTAIGTSIYFYKKANVGSAKTQVDDREELVRIVGLVSKHIVLPDDEEPNLATVNDPSQLASEPFFHKAKKGFKVLIYPNAQKAILYDPENDRLVEVSPIRVADEAKSSVDVENSTSTDNEEITETP